METTIKKSIKLKMGKPRLPIGKHSLEIKELSEIEDAVSKYGNPCQTIEICLVGKVLGRDMEVWRKLWIHSSPSSLFQQLAFATGIEVDEDEEGKIDLEDAIGKSVIVEVEQQGNLVNIVGFISTKRVAESIFRRI
ncbi:hypothetical protein [Sporosarcina sp. FSL K6-5500]|uniref:hypothetical protein n=1 Tax=Sporosarcina sp. FSL K6-5500 TaxID=2921558 RepID=UPI0030F7C9E5